MVKFFCRKKHYPLHDEEHTEAPIFKVEEAHACLQAGLWILTRPLYDRYPVGLPIEELCRKLGIGRTAAYEAAGQIGSLLNARAKPPAPAADVAARNKLKEKDFEIDVLRYERDHPGAREPGIRTQFDAEYKAFVDGRRARYGVTIKRAGAILGIPIDTLKKFSRVSEVDTTDRSEQLPEYVIELINAFLRGGDRSRSVKRFCACNPELLSRLGMDYREVVHWLRRLGFVSRRGIFLKNKGLDKILRFKPNQVWGTDGKNMIITVNGEIFNWVWQCLIDYKTTVIVSGITSGEENTDNLAAAIEGASPKDRDQLLAIVLDNRLSENLPAIKAYLDERNIKIIKTFPGNAKSNGIVEGNFNIFDRWVGAVHITGTTPEEISRSVAEAVVQIFTQMRNHRPRKALSYKTPREVMDQAPPCSPEEEALTREKLQALADRLKNEQATPIVSTEKQAAIDQAVEKIQPPQPEPFKKALQAACYTPDLILGSLAVFEQQKQNRPEKNFGHSYFGGILRNQVDQSNVEALNMQLGSVYAHHWATMSKLRKQDLAGSLRFHPVETCTRLAKDFMNMPVPAFASRCLVDLKETFFLASRGSSEVADELRQAIAGFVIESKRATKDKRETLLRKLFEWNNFIRLSDRDAADWPASPVGNA